MMLPSCYANSGSQCIFGISLAMNAETYHAFHLYLVTDLKCIQGKQKKLVACGVAMLYATPTTPSFRIEAATTLSNVIEASSKTCTLIKRKPKLKHLYQLNMHVSIFMSFLYVCCYIVTCIRRSKLNPHIYSC